MIKNGCSQNGHGILKLTVSQKWIDRTNWFFCMLVHIKKAKSSLNDFWVVVVKNRHGYLVQ